MSGAELSRFCNLFEYVYVEDAVMNGISGCWFIDFGSKRKWFADTEIEFRLRSN